MNRDETKLILQSYRPGGQDRDNPAFAEALTELERDPELKQWFQAESAFDAAMAEHVQSVAVPPGLKQKILASGPRPKIADWLAWKVRPAYAVAVCVLFLATIFGFWWKMRPATFADFCQAMANRSWALTHHVEFESDNLSQVRAWLAGRQAQNTFQLPSALQAARVRGCSVVEWEGRKLPMLCLMDGSRHMHLLIAAGVDTEGGPEENQPMVIDYGQLQTAIWVQKDKTYILTGINVRNFVRMFRHAGQWNLAS